MKKLLSILIFGLSISCLNAQDGEFVLTVNPDTIGVGQMLEIRITIKNMKGDMVSQTWDESLLTYSPSVSNRTSIMNGQMTQSKEYVYAVKATQEGTFPIAVQVKLQDTGEIIVRNGEVVVVAGLLEPKMERIPEQDLQFKRRDRNDLPETNVKKKRKIYRL